MRRFVGFIPVVVIGALAALIGALLAAPPSGAVVGTVKVVVRPVTAAGHPAPGYRVTREHIPGFTCDGTSASAVDPNIEFCGFSATYTPSCWKSSNHTVLCLRSVTRKVLVRIRYTGSFTPAAAPNRPAPQAISLRDNGLCTIRDGGAWGFVKQHPNWVGYYGCHTDAVYGPPRGDGIDRTVNPWRVHLVTGYYKNGNAKLATDRVLRAYYVGTASI